MVKVKRMSLETLRREEILQAALGVIAEKGRANVTLEDIAKAYGCSKGGITYYYSSKEALFKDVFKYFFDTISQKTQKELDKHLDPLSKMLSFIWFVDEENPQTMLMYPLLFEMMSIAYVNTEYQEAFHEWMKSRSDTVLTIVEEGKNAGIFQVDDAAFAVLTVTAAGHGIITRWYLDRKTYSTEWAKKALQYTVIQLLQVKPA